MECRVQGVWYALSAAGVNDPRAIIRSRCRSPLLSGRLQNTAEHSECSGMHSAFGSQPFRNVAEIGWVHSGGSGGRNGDRPDYNRHADQWAAPMAPAPRHTPHIPHLPQLTTPAQQSKVASLAEARVEVSLDQRSALALFLCVSGSGFLYTGSEGPAPLCCV